MNSLLKLADLVRVKPNILKTFGLSNNDSEDFTMAQTYVFQLYSSKKTQCATPDKHALWNREGDGWKASENYHHYKDHSK